MVHAHTPVGVIISILCEAVCVDVVSRESVEVALDNEVPAFVIIESKELKNILDEAEFVAETFVLVGCNMGTDVNIDDEEAAEPVDIADVRVVEGIVSVLVVIVLDKFKVPRSATFVEEGVVIKLFETNILLEV